MSLSITRVGFKPNKGSLFGMQHQLQLAGIFRARLKGLCMLPVLTHGIWLNAVWWRA